MFLSSSIKSITLTSNAFPISINFTKSKIKPCNHKALFLSKSYLNYKDAALNSAPSFFIAFKILLVVFSPAKAVPVLYCLIFDSLIPA